MEISIRYIAVIVLVLLTVLGVLATTEAVLGDSGSDIEDAGEDRSDDIDCILDNPEDPDRCIEDSTFEEVKEAERSV